MKLREEIKQKYIDYYRNCPIQRYAAAAVGVSERTIIRWREKDVNFVNRIEAAKSLWIKDRVSKMSPEKALEKIEAEIFGKKLCEHEDDPVYQTFKRFGFVFTMNKEELKAFIKSGMSKANLEST